MIWTGRILRAVAIAIAVLGVIDPVLTWSRADRPVVALVDAGAPQWSAQLTRELSREFDVQAGAMAGAAATVLAGASLPTAPVAVSGALIAATPALVTPRVEIERLSAPSTAAMASRISVSASLRAVGANGRTLRIDVADGTILLDRAAHIVKGDDERFAVTLSAPALEAGLSRFVVRVSDDGGTEASLNAEGAVITEAAPVRWKVLVVDARPSWASSFVRRALEDDRRFDVASRMTTSRAIAVQSGSAPALSDVAGLEQFSAIVVGAPDALTTADVRALEMFARGRGGAVVLLMDRAEAGASVVISGAGSFRDVHGVERRKVAGDAGAMVATELAVPESLVAGAEVLASTGTGAAMRAAVWQVPLGAGRVIVSGALDAWRYRAREQNGFGRFWTSVVSAAAAAAPPPLMVLPATRIVSPSADVDVRVVVRQAQLSDASKPAPSIDVRARLVALDPSGKEQALRLWPTAERGVFVAPVRLPSETGTFRVIADARDGSGQNIGTASAELMVVDGASTRSDIELTSWTTAHGGVVLAAARGVDVAAAIRARTSRGAQPKQIHPMRSLWWLPLFIGVLGGEWWLRRRRGER